MLMPATLPHIFHTTAMGCAAARGHVRETLPVYRITAVEIADEGMFSPGWCQSFETFEAISFLYNNDLGAVHDEFVALSRAAGLC
jgi:hypothetical protein